MGMLDGFEYSNLDFQVLNQLTRLQLRANDGLYGDGMASTLKIVSMNESKSWFQKKAGKTYNVVALVDGGEGALTNL